MKWSRKSVWLPRQLQAQIAITLCKLQFTTSNEQVLYY